MKTYPKLCCEQPHDKCSALGIEREREGENAAGSPNSNAPLFWRAAMRSDLFALAAAFFAVLLASARGAEDLLARAATAVEEKELGRARQGLAFSPRFYKKSTPECVEKLPILYKKAF